MIIKRKSFENIFHFYFFPPACRLFDAQRGGGRPPLFTAPFASPELYDDVSAQFGKQRFLLRLCPCDSKMREKKKEITSFIRIL